VKKRACPEKRKFNSVEESINKCVIKINLTNVRNLKHVIKLATIKPVRREFIHDSQI